MRQESRARLTEAEIAAIIPQHSGALLFCKLAFAEASKLRSPKNYFFPTAETIISQTLAEEVPSVSQHHMPRESLLSSYNGASGREGNCETRVTLSGK